MDEQQLKDMLSSLTAPEPSKTSKNQALENAMAAFDKKIGQSTQGSNAAHRLTGINQTLNHIRRWIMNKRFIVSGTTGAVAVCALVAVLGGPFFYQQVERISGGMDDAASANKSIVGAGAVGNVRVNVGTEEADPVYEQAIRETNQQVADEARSSGTSAIPIPLSTPDQDGITMPDAPPEVANDPLRQWRQSLDATKAASPKKSDQGFVGDTAAAAVDQAIVSNVPKNKAVEESRRRAESKEVLKKENVDKAISSNRVKMQDRASPEEMASGTGAAVPSSAVMQEAEMVAPQLQRAIAAPKQMPQPVPVDVITTSYQDVGRDQFQKFEENSVKAVNAEPVSTFSIDVDTASYAFARKAINQGYLPQANAVRIEEMINYFDYNYAVPETGGHPFQPTVAVYDSPWRSGTKLIHIGIKGYEVQKEMKSNLVFLIDTSGSMNSPDKLPLLVNSFKMMLDNLAPDDTVGIVVYAGSAGTVLEPTKVADKHKIMQALERLQAGGSTAGAAGIEQAYALAERSFIKQGNNRIILATDGDFNVGITNRDELKTFVERKRDQGISLSVLGFGQGNYNDHMMQTLAQNGNGNAAYIDSLSEARKVLVEEASSTLFTIAKDVKIQVEFNPTLVQEYRLVGYETRHLNREDFNNDKVDAGEVGAGHTVTAIYEITPVGMQPMVDDLRYQKPASALEKKVDRRPVVEGNGDEYAFLKMRYKRPDENTSILMTRPITKQDEKSFNALPDDIRFANAVAGFAQLLKGSKFVGNLTYEQVVDIANAARGKDEFGYRTEFVNLVRLAKSAAAMQNQR